MPSRGRADDTCTNSPLSCFPPLRGQLSHWVETFLAFHTLASAADQQSQYLGDEARPRYSGEGNQDKFPRGRKKKNLPVSIWEFSTGERRAPSWLQETNGWIRGDSVVLFEDKRCIWAEGWKIDGDQQRGSFSESSWLRHRRNGCGRLNLVPQANLSSGHLADPFTHGEVQIKSQHGLVLFVKREHYTVVACVVCAWAEASDTLRWGHKEDLPHSLTGVISWLISSFLLSSCSQQHNIFAQLTQQQQQRAAVTAVQMKWILKNVLTLRRAVFASPQNHYVYISMHSKDSDLPLAGVV